MQAMENPPTEEFAGSGTSPAIDDRLDATPKKAIGTETVSKLPISAHSIVINVDFFMAAPLFSNIASLPRALVCVATGETVA